MNNLDPMRDEAGARLRRLRLRRGMPLAVLAGHCGVTAAFLSMVENGHRQLHRPSHITALAAALGASPYTSPTASRPARAGKHPGRCPRRSPPRPTAPP